MNELSIDQVSEATALAEWKERRSAEAFQLIVEWHYGWVLATARRRMSGWEGLAPEVAQDVFTELAQRADRIRPECLGGWLHRHTLFCAAKTLRRERRRQVREAAGGQVMNENAQPNDSERAVWADLSPVLDETLQTLPEGDREALILRFFRALPLAEIGSVAGISAGAAQKRVDRALERLRRALDKRGVRKSALCLGTSLATATPPPVRAAVVEKVTRQAVTGVSSATVSGFPWGAMAAAMALCTGAGGWVGYRPQAASSPPGNAPAIQPGADPVAEDRFRGRLAELMRTGKDGLPALRSFRLAAALSEEPDASVPALSRYATAHTTDSAVLDALLHRWALIDVKAAWAYFSEHGGHAAVLADGLTLLARREPAGAAAFYESLPDGKDKALPVALQSGLGASDPKLAQQVAVRLAKGLPRYEAGYLLQPLFEAWAQRDPKSAAEAALAGDPALNRRGQPDAGSFTQTIRLWAQTDPSGAASFIRSMKPGPSDDLRNRARDAGLQAVVETHPENTAIWLTNSHTDDIAVEGTMNAGLKSTTVRGMAEVAEKWSAADPEGAQRFAAETPFPVLRRSILLGCAAALAVRDAEAATALADQQTETSLRYALREVIEKKQTEQKQP